MFGDQTGRHRLQTNFCWTSVSTSGAANTLHAAESVGFLGGFIQFTTTGDQAGQTGNSSYGVGYARCTANGKLLSSSSNTYIKHFLYPNGLVAKDVPRWTC